MNHVSVLSAIFLVAFAAGICRADSLVITYKSGKTQTIVLEEPSQGINSWQFVSGAVPQQQSKFPDEAPATAVQGQVKNESTSLPQKDEKAPEKKSGMRVKWNAKPIAD